MFKGDCDGAFSLKSNFAFQVSDPKHPPMLLQGHSEEVTSVAWCPTDFTKVRQQTFFEQPIEIYNQSQVW